MRLLLIIVGFLSSLIIFMPKSNLYFKLQELLQTKNIYINSDIKDSFVLELKNGIVYINKMDVIKFKDCKILPFILYNNLKCDNINFLNNYKLNLNTTYSILNPTNIIVKGKSNFGVIDGEINIPKRSGKIYIRNITNSEIKKFLKKDKKGYYYYAKF